MIKQKVILIGGPTGVGKTALAIKLARLFDGEIISCDSVAIYKKLNIGSAKPTPEEQKQAKHYMIDIVEPDCEYSVSDYRNESERLILDIASRGKTPIVVGGTGLYMKALLFPMELGKSEKNEAMRQKYRQLALEKGNQFLLDYLKQIDPQSAQNLHEKDLPRIIRAIEIYETTG
ncbi:MAG TPA: tRNA (adenosine(37)-N6)-dimethylallyltransferase MiaA, partial [Clostridiales bacterium]|nr:tRNA (adenosine(37)-N6)-dimethylallyltransferase MiaA [Clostridiales bacterium]